MKKILFILMLAQAMLLISSHSMAQDRTPIYVHGNNGDATQWENWQTLFNLERRMQRGTNNQFNTTNGVVAMAGAVTFPATYNNTIFFGHSMGGVVGRHLDAGINNVSLRFGGIITAGSPLDGAGIANSINNGQAANFISDGVDKVLKGPIRQLGQNAGVLFAVDGTRLKNAADELINKVLSTGYGRGNATTSDLSEGSAYMNSGIRNISTSRPKIHIYGNENSPGIWRIVSSSQGKRDDYYVELTLKAYDVYTAAKWANISASVTRGWFTLGIGAAYYLWVAEGWGQGANWLKDGSERGWNDLIRASSPSSSTLSYSSFDYQQFSQCMSSGSNVGYTRYMQCQQQSTHTYYYTYYSPVNGISDAFIKAPSATGFNSAWSNNAIKIEALGVNHLEMKGHYKMKEIYDGIFNGKYNIQTIDPFFKTDRR
jgi:hypothetical protein